FGLVRVEQWNCTVNLRSELALPLPRVDVDPQALEGRFDSLQHGRNGIARECGELLDVATAIAVVWWLFPSANRLHRRVEPLHLSPGVVVVVLALDGVTRERQ